MATAVLQLANPRQEPEFVKLQMQPSPNPPDIEMTGFLHRMTHVLQCGSIVGWAFSPLQFHP
jgi:hypothetical protein